ncbi:16S rRNA (guanine(966)-N(2))-methyltransferase RsmD [Anaerosporobacter faecicola]|uniref:16S rRNA (guanine(966)-N(2))-methyltransferase RsmD n=1 Tax=Anaerosporobacter faecicola TaxID=2718714 RepID=UPI00143998C4|nr:16S rRNA (guanine(966)-N(2))-methyltransferase RsmD [Anaerosporobacter faecicola]
MRVIAGKAKRLQLKTIAGLDTRPTTDRIKETLFNILAQDLADCDFLDLFSGSGAIGIEALSRGAKSAVFVENNKAAIDCIKANLKITNLADAAQVLMMDVIAAIQYAEKNGKVFDIIFMDPPYNKDLEKMVLEYLEHSSVIYYNTLIVVEASLDTDFSYLENSSLEVYRTKEYKTNKHVFIQKCEETN